MIQILKELNLLDFAIAISGIFIMIMAVVYIPGRMFEIVNSFRIKYFIALIASFGFSYFYLKTFGKRMKDSVFLYNLVLHSLSVIFVYVVFGMRLFDRIDGLLDRKVGKDKGFKRK